MWSNVVYYRRGVQSAVGRLAANAEWMEAQELCASAQPAIVVTALGACTACLFVATAVGRTTHVARRN